MLTLRNLKQVLRMGSNTRFRSSATAVYEEVRIPVPWGHIAGKWWGPQDKRPILTLHGWQDNCGSFDRLIPVLPNDLSYLTIDMSGHGLSSKIPPGMFYHGINGAIMICQIKEYFGWNKISLMGHSLGAITSYTYGFLFADTVDFCVCIDGMHPLIHPEIIKRSTRTIEQFLKYDKLNSSESEPPNYTMEEMEQLLHKGTRKSIDLDKCKYILKRNIKPSSSEPGKFYFNRDARLKCGPLLSWSEDQLHVAAANITFPICLSKAELSPFFESEAHYQKIIDIMKQASKDCQFHSVPGTHHGHLNTPEIFKDIIPTFIRKYDIEDRSVSGFKDEIRLKNCKSNL